MLDPTAGVLQESGSPPVGAGVPVIDRGAGGVAGGGMIIDCVPSAGRPPFVLPTAAGATGDGPIGVVGIFEPGGPE